MDDNQRNLLLAVVFSVVILIGWQALVGVPTMQEERAKQEQAANRTAETVDATPRPPGDAAPAGGVVPQPSGGAAPDAGPKPEAGPVAPGVAMGRQAALSSTKRLPFENDVVKGSIALTGARIDDLILKTYRVTVNPNSENVVLLSPSGSQAPYYADYGWTATKGGAANLPNAQTVWTAETPGKLTPTNPVTLVWDNGQGLIFRRTISLDDRYLFTIRQEVENKTDKAVTLFPYALISRHGRPQTEGFYILHEGLVGVLGEDGLQEIDYEDALEEGSTAFRANQGWLGISDKYWAVVQIPEPGTEFSATFRGFKQNGRQTFQTDYLTGAVTVAPGAKASVSGKLFSGAKEVDVVDRYEKEYNIQQFDLLIDWGWFYFITKPLFYVLDYFYRLVGNFGVSILIVTVLIKLFFFPLANKSYVSMGKMKKLQPEMLRIRERFKDDKVRQQQAMMDLYKKEKVNPMSGCLPILIQIPVFFALYKVLYVSIEMRHAPFFGWIKDLSAPDPTSIFNLFGLIPWTPPSFLILGVWPIIMGITMAVQMKLNPPPQDPIQQKIFAWMPVIFTFLLASFPAGLVIYWAWNNLLSIIQQWYIMSKEGVEIALFENLGLKKNKQPGGTKSP